MSLQSIDPFRRAPNKVIDHFAAPLRFVDSSYIKKKRRLYPVTRAKLYRINSRRRFNSDSDNWPARGRSGKPAAAKCPSVGVLKINALGKEKIRSHMLKSMVHSSWAGGARRLFRSPEVSRNKSWHTSNPKKMKAS